MAQTPDGLLRLHRRQRPQRCDLHRQHGRSRGAHLATQTKAIPGFTARYGCDKLVRYEVHDTREAAFQRERRIKEWRLSWKMLAIEEYNPTWADLYETLA